MWPTHYIPNKPREDGIPPPRYYLTTPPYPLELVEEMESNPGPPDVGFVPAFAATEIFQSGGQPVSGVIKSILVETSVLPDHIWSNGNVVSGSLRTILKETDIGIDRLQSNGAVISGALRDPLVRYDNWPLGFDSEDLFSAGMPVSGALT